MRIFLQCSKRIERMVLIVLSTIMIQMNLDGAITVTQGLPDTLRICEGSTLSFSVTATGDSLLSYDWTKDLTPVGTNSPMLNMGVVSVVDGGTYAVLIKEKNTSNAITLQCVVFVNKKPEILQQPTGNSPICAGDTLRVASIVNNGTLVWKKDGMMMPSMTNDSFQIDSITSASSGNYQLMITALPGCRDTFSNVYIVDVRNPLMITTHPMGALLRDNASMAYTLRVSVSGSGPFSYEWYKDDVIIPGQVDDSLRIISFLTVNDSGKYYVIVRTSAPCNNMIQSNDAFLTPTLCPIIISQRYNSMPYGPTDTTFTACQNGLLDIEVTAVGVREYQWYLNGVPKNGAIYRRLSIANFMSSDEGVYSVVCLPDTGLTCPLTASTPVKVTMKPRQTYTLQPLPNPSCEATSHTMTVNASNTTGYQWYRNGVAIPGANMNSYTVSSINQTAQEFLVHALNSYCPPHPSNKVLVKQVDPNLMVGVQNVSRMNLMEQCTDKNGWTYYAHSDNIYEMLIAIRKNGNNVNFNPSVKYNPLGIITESKPDTVERKGIIIGRRRMFSISVDSGQLITKPYDVKFYYPNIEKNEFLNQIYKIQNDFAESFSTSWSTSNVSFITSTQNVMDDSLVINQKFPLTFKNAIASDVKFGVENKINFAEINKLVADKGGATFYFDYFSYKRSTGSISTTDMSFNVSIYPVPASNNLTIDYNNVKKKDMKVEVYDQVGRLLHSSVLKGTKNRDDLDISGYAGGNYLIRVSDDNQSIQSKFTIKR